MNIKRNIIFAPESRKKNGVPIVENVPIRMRVIYASHRIEFTTGYRIDIAKWDADKQRVKNGCTNKLKQSASEINADLLRYYAEIQNVFKEFEVQETMPTTQQLKDAFNLRMKNDSEEQQEDTKISFWEIFDERLELCHEALMYRHNRLKGTPSDVAPILWQNGALARLKKGETIDKLLYGGYSTISLGYAGLCECTKYMVGVTHTQPEGTEFALKVMRHLNEVCKKWAKETNIDFSLYGTPLESTTYKFAKNLQKRFGKIPGVTDKNYITNSYHVHVTEDINAFDKLKFESQFQELSPGGAISYVEVPDMVDNIPAVLSVMQYIYENIMYAELNTKSDYCQVCGYNGEIRIVTDEDGKLIWECPNCGNRNQDKMNVARRTCGYIGTQFWNQGRTQEIKERVLHL